MYIQSYRPDNATRPGNATGNEHEDGQRSESESVGSGATNNLRIKIILTFYHFHSKSYYLAQLF